MSARVVPRLVIEGCTVATVDPNRNEYASGHLVVEGGELRTADEAEVARDDITLRAGSSHREAES
jgi:hypothetical protein